MSSSRSLWGALQRCVVIGVALLATTAVCQASTMSFTQLSFKLDGVAAYTDTEYGCVKLEYTGDAMILYLNVSVNGSWQVQNVPITSPEGPGVTQTVAVDVDLGVARGTAVSSVQYGYTLDMVPLLAMPASTTAATVAPETIAQWGGLDEGVMFDDLPPAGPHVGGMVVDPVGRHVATGMPNQQCGPRECVPAAVSNSLHYLREKWGLPLTDAQISLQTMKDATGWYTGCWAYDGTHGSYPHNAWYKDKRAWMHAAKYPISTRVMTDMNDLIREIDEDQDIELIYQWTTAEGKTAGHAVTVKSITPLGDGRYSLTLSSDWDQESNTEGCYDLKAIYDPATGELDLGRHGIRDFQYAVVECPEPAAAVIAVLSSLAVLRRRRGR